MTSTAPERQIDRAYRRALLAIQAATIRDALRLWPALRFADLASTYPAWLAAMRTLIERNRETAVGVTGGYVTAAWFAAGNAGVSPSIPELDLFAEQVETSLRVTSIVAYRRSLGVGMTPQAANESALVQMSGSAARLVAEAGRLAALEAIRDVPEARWRRVASPGACNFCQLLAGRGYVYLEDTVDFPAHDHCGCSVAIQFSGALAA